MSPQQQPLGVVLVPAASVARELLIRAASLAGLRVVEEPEQAILCLADLTSPEGSAALSAFLGTPAAAGLSLVALVEPGAEGFAALESLRPADVLTTGGLPFELAWRLRRVVERERERQEHLRRQSELSLQGERELAARIAAEARAASLETYRLFFAHVCEGVAILDDRACVLCLNPMGESILDISSAVASGRHVAEVVQSRDEGALMELVTSARRGESRAAVDLVVSTPAGRRLTLSLSSAPLEDGRRASILSFRDVTRARELEDNLRQTKDFLERLIDSSVDAIVAADMQGRIILFNKGAEALSGYSSREALAGLHVRQLYPEGMAERLMSHLRSPEFGGRGRLSVCRQDIVHRNGQLVPVNMTASIVYEGGREVASMGIFTDLRDRMALERKLSDVETRLEQSEQNAVIVALAGTAAHELNQPLTSVMGYAELLKRRLDEEDPVCKSVDIIYREAERMAEIVRKIGRITRFETKSYMGSQQIVDLDKASSHDE